MGKQCYRFSYQSFSGAEINDQLCLPAYSFLYSFVKSYLFKDMWLWQGSPSPHATKVAFFGALRHRTRVVQGVYLEFQAGGIHRADGTNCHASGSSSSVCVDGWFILGAMIALMHHRCAASPSQSPIRLRTGEAVNQPSTTHTPHTPSTVVQRGF